MKIKDLPAVGIRPFHILNTDDTVAEAVQKMSAHSVSELVVMENGLTGVFSAKDVMCCHILFPNRPLNEISIKEVVTPRPALAEPDHTVEETLERMIRSGYHQLPVVSEGRIAGLLYIEDMIRPYMEALTQEIQYLKEYISDLQDAAHD